MKIKNKIKITVNGKQMQVIPNFSLKSLITKLKIPLNKIAIELNKKIIDKKMISKINLRKGDKIEIVHFIGGG
jgi:thiamine biosynthesis protein ThiS